MRSWSCATIAVSLLVGAVCAQDDAAKKDLDNLQGVWQLVSVEVQGKTLPEDQVKGSKMTFKGNKASHPGPDGKIEEGTFKFDPSKKPKEIDMSPLAGPDKGKTLLGIYSIEGDTLKICAAKLGHDRPAEFKAGKDVILMVLKRDKR